jgi:hypothetical protein
MVNGKIFFAARGAEKPLEITHLWYTSYTPGDPISYGWKMIPGVEGFISGPGVASWGGRAHIYYLDWLGRICQVNEGTAGKEDWKGPFCPII